MFNKMLRIVFALAVIATVFTSANQAKAQIVTEGLVSYWTFDKADITDKTVKDVWGNNDGTIEEDPQIVKGKIGEALEFDGKGDCVNLGDMDASEGLKAATYGAWVKIKKDPNTALQLVASKADGATYPWQLLLCKKEGDELGFAFSDTDKKFTRHMADSPASPNTWYHIVAVLDTSEPQATIGKLYINGEPQSGKGTNVGCVSSANKDIPKGATQGSNAGDALIGARDNGGKHGNFFNGIIDEFHIYNRALSHDEIKQNFAAKLGLSVADSTGKLTLTWGKIKVSR